MQHVSLKWQHSLFQHDTITQNRIGIKNFLFLYWSVSNFRRTNSHGKYRKISNIPKGDFSSALVAENIMLKPGRNEFVVKSKVWQCSVMDVRRHFGHAVAQAVSCRPLTVETRVCTWVGPCGICGGHSGTVTGFSSNCSVLPCQYHSNIDLHTHVSPGGWTVGLLVATVQRHSLTHWHEQQQ
jgi:hypothetical protein